MIFFGAPIKKHGLYLFFSVLLYISFFVLTQIAAQFDLLRLIPLFLLVPLGSFDGWLPLEALPFFFGLTHLVQALRVIKQEQHSFSELLGVWNDQGDHQFGRLASIQPYERFSKVAIINSRFLAPYRLFHKLTRQDMQHALMETRARTSLQNRQILLQFIIFASFIFVVGWYRIGLFATGKYLTFLSFPLVLAMLLVFGGMVWLSKRQDLIASIDLWFDYEVAPRLIEGDAAAQAITQSLEKLTEQQDEHMNRLLELTESSRDSLAGGLSDLDNNLSNHADELSRIHTELLSLNHAVSKEGEAIRGAIRWESLDTFLESFSS